MINVSLKVIEELLKLTMCLFCVTVRIAHKETPCAHEVNENHINQGQIMQCIITYVTGMYL